MKQVFIKNMHLLFFAAFVTITSCAGSQEFKGFYGNNTRTGSYSPAGRYYRHRSAATRRYDYSVNSPAFNYGVNPFYPNGYSFPPFAANDRPYPPIGFTINIFSSDRTQQLPATSNYIYYNGAAYRRNNDGDYQVTAGRDNINYNNIPAGGKTIKINGDRFYEVNGNYYRADRFDNAGNVTPVRTQGGNNYYTVQSYPADNNVYIPAQNRVNNTGYLYDSKQMPAVVYATDPNQNNKVEYADKRLADNTLFMSEQQRKALQGDNDKLRQNENDRQAQEAKNTQQIIKDDRDRQAKDREQARQEQKASDDRQISTLQDQKKEDDRRQKETDKNNAAEQDELYSNLKVGDTVDQIPKKSKTVTIDGKKTYVSPRNIYYRKQNGKYTVVGME